MRWKSIVLANRGVACSLDSSPTNHGMSRCPLRGSLRFIQKNGFPSRFNQLLMVVLLAASPVAMSEVFSAKVIVVMDGDTVMVLRGGQKIKVRMANIDAPEKDQAFGKQSRESLLEMIDKRQVQIDSQAVDQYGRMIGLISVDGRNINQEQVQRGMAWEYSHYHTDKTYVGLQSAAQQAHRGLWAQTSPQAPWQWRKLHPSVKPMPRVNLYAAPSLATPVMLYDMECGKKRRCSQMVSCDEAYFYFTLCGVSTLDGNHDGVPCENSCEGKR